MKLETNFPILTNDLIIRAAYGEETERTPVWLMRQAGRYLPEFREVYKKHDFFTLCKTPELACEVTLQPIDRYSGLLDASIIFCDILVVPQAFGLDVEILPAKGPYFPSPLKTLEDLQKFSKKEINVEKELNYVFKAITLTRTKLNGRVPLFGFAGSPWTLFAYMVEGCTSKTWSVAKKWLFSNPKECCELLQTITDVVIEFLIGQVKAGAQLLQVFDSFGGELTPAMFLTFSYPYLQQIVTRVKSTLKSLNLKVPLFIFAKGVHSCIESLSTIGFDVISLDWMMDVKQAQLKLQGKVALQGNADPALLFAPNNVIQDEVADMLRNFGSVGYIANLGHGMLPDHDPEKVRVFLQAIKEYSSNAGKKRKIEKVD
ncbi:hypothetical protein HK099_000187 [Clydaea vesicula]|uniref:Uroporphyrinogen decarboxylase n=1 Tax=Clydaea vesicula TaxID=447962 RepID=A0AAD5U4F5_9FUNG|nr:hypothetical protein HK099_000187 [Clydaea vesicula]